MKTLFCRHKWIVMVCDVTYEKTRICEKCGLKQNEIRCWNTKKNK